MTIKIPEKFDEKLEGNYRSYIDNTISSYSSIIQENKLEFFNEYTDHGIEHIEDVLNSSLSLLDEDTLLLLNCKDITVLIISVILHDVGMHLSSEGFKKILDSEFDFFRVSYFDDKSWAEEWQEFLHEAKRFNDEQLENIFGSSNVEILEPDFDNLNDVSRKLCGEFLRRHHARLAHEIVFSGFPAKIGEQNIKPASNIDDEIIDLCGLVARSHGMNLRDSFDYLKNKHFDAWKAPYDIKCLFLMVVLRISDYIQIHADRANSIIVKTKRFSSPTSIKEWEKHEAIRHISIKTVDPERIYVTAKPNNSLIYLELKKLLSDIQYEFDLSWAILGEVYGKDYDFSNLKIRFRRITSNLDDTKKFVKTVNYIPERIRFDADPELLKLLIGPLYGEDPKYGMRELLQNSVDAVKERHYVDKNQHPKIVVTLNNESQNDKIYYLTIKDNGIGMSKDTIINFFFKAGASFRNSMVWKKSFVENKDVKIEKTGRFGVGVLAAFLLGDEFEMLTKYYNSDEGYYCKASLSSKQVELIKKECEIGTSLKIKLNEKNSSLFQNLLRQHQQYSKRDRERLYYSRPSTLDWFNWYFMNSPEIIYNIENKELESIFYFEDFKISSNSKTPLKGWYSFGTEEFKSIHWSINSGGPRYYGEPEPREKGLFCNGFNITRGFKLPNFPWKTPIISVFDGNAKMPLSLSRDYLLNDRLPFENELIRNICLKVIEKILSTEFTKINEYWIPKPNIIEFYKTKIDLSKFIVVSGEKFTLMTPFIFKVLEINSFYQLWIKNSESKSFLFKEKDTYYQANYLKNDPNYVYKNLLDPKSYGETLRLNWFNLGSSKKRNDLLCNNYILNDKLAFMLEKNRLTKTFRSNHKSSLYNDRWAVTKDYRKADDFYGRDPEKKKSIEKEIKELKEDSKIIKQNLTDENYYFVKENYISVKELFSFEQFKNIWESIHGTENYLIPIEKEYRKQVSF